MVKPGLCKLQKESDREGEHHNDALSPETKTLDGNIVDYFIEK